MLPPFPRIYHTIVHRDISTQPPSEEPFLRHRINYVSLLPIQYYPQQPVEQRRQYKATQNGPTSSCSISQQTNRQTTETPYRSTSHSQSSHQQEVHFAAWRFSEQRFCPWLLPTLAEIFYLLISFFYSARTTSRSPITHFFTPFFSSYVLFVSSSLSSICRSGKTEPSGSKQNICVLSGK